jgi:hypothetical protein
MKKFNTIFLSLILLPLTIFSQTNPKVNPSNFSFAVLGDRTGSAEQPIFEQVLVTVKSLNPNFVVNVGDLIEGYSQNNDTLNNQWNFIFENLQDIKEKFFFTPGNHDALDSLSLQIYLSRIGYKRSYYSFSVGKNHFVVLDNARQEKIEKIDSTQIQWLITELSKYKKSDNIFCFMHRSFWKDAYNNNKPDTFHKIFTKYGVDYVFSGHDHFYCQLIWDGITYTQVGPSGSRYKVYYNEAYGAFQNFVLVSVKNNKVEIKLLRPDATELPSDYVTFNNIQELQKIEQLVEIYQMGITTSRISFGGGPDSETTVYLDTIVVKIDNPFDFQLNTIGKWDLNSEHWLITPSECMIYILPKGSRSYKFHWRIENESIYPLPQFSCFYPYAMGKKSYNIERILPIHLSAECHKTNHVIKIDGKLDEKIWQIAKPINIFGSSEGKLSETDPWQVHFAYDNSNLYIAVKMTDYEPDKIVTKIKNKDEKVYQDDHFNIVLTPQINSGTYYQFFINSNGVVMDRICKMEGKDSKKDAKWNSNITVKGEIVTSENFSGWILEMAIPYADLDVFYPLGDGLLWGFNLVRYQTRTDKVSIYSIPFEHNPATFAKLDFIR